MEKQTNDPIVNEVPMPSLTFNRDGVEKVLKSRFFIAPSFSIYGGTGGLFDYGPPGCALKSNLIDFWRQHFVITENMLEVDCTCLTPEEVLIASGHVAKFQDLMVKDTVNGNCLRADHLLEEWLDKLIEKTDDAKLKDEYETVKALADDYSVQDLAQVLKKYGVKSVDGNPITDPFPFNLMFDVSIGPTGNKKGYLRPETAQSIFVNFKRLLEYNGGKLPFAAAQIGLAFRNEIAPRAGVLRVREFQMAEIEHFVKEDDKNHPKFKDVKHLKLNLFPRPQQTGSKNLVLITLEEAVEEKIIGNQTLAYFMARTYLFLLAVGIKPDGLRFRQHLTNEMAHYAQDCWDAEVKNSYGWTEVVGHADRSCFDLTRHSEDSNETLTAFERFDEPRLVKRMECVLNKGLMGRTFKNANKAITTHLERMKESDLQKLEKELASGSAKITVGGTEYTLTKEMVTVKSIEEKVSGQNFLPHVIEPSFGIGRIVYSVLEHSFWTREGDEQRNVLSLPARVAPVKCSVLPLVSNQKIEDLIPVIVNTLTSAAISYKVDSTGQAIGRKYARTDEIGIPFGVTIDFQTVEDNTVTLRERDSTAQVRVPIADLARLITEMVDGRRKWEDVKKQYPAVTVKEDTSS